MAGLIDNLPEGLEAYERGFIAGLYAYAHMKDGTYYVGTTGRTLEEAIRRFLKDRDKPVSIPADYADSAE